MEYAYRGEQLTPSNSGRMDQACAFSEPVLLTFDGPMLHCEPLELQCELHFVVVDLRARKDTSLILRALQRAYSHDTPTKVRFFHSASLCVALDACVGWLGCLCVLSGF